MPNDPSLTLPEFLARRARAASDRRLAIDAGAGVVVAVAALVLRPPAWLPMVCAALCFLAFGVWGILDRELAGVGAGPRATVLRTVRAMAAVAGVAAALGLLLVLFGYALGTWIS